MGRTGRRTDSITLVVAVFGLSAGVLADAAGLTRIAVVSLVATTVAGIVLSTSWVIADLRARRVGVDGLALLALIGALALGENIAGALITVMLATGRALEAWAEGRAERELRLLLQRAPQVAHRYHRSAIVEISVGDVIVGDVLLVRPGEVLPVDGTLRSTAAVIDESALTGEPLPVSFGSGDRLRGGSVNAGGPLDLLATTSADESTYAGIVRLVQDASASTAPFVRAADRFATWFLIASLGLAGGAWLWSGEVERAVAVLVVATPCPLILAAPVAIVAGLSRAARRGVVVKGGAALEALGDADVLLFDKTGTLTKGLPTISEVVLAPSETNGSFGSDDVLRLAASIDQMSPHVIAAAIVRAAHSRHLVLSEATGTEEVAGGGIRGIVEGHQIAVGNRDFVQAADEAWVMRALRRSEYDGALTVFVAIDAVPVGVLILDDPVRADAGRAIRNLRRAGISRVVMVTGDRIEVAGPIGAMVGVDQVEASQSPADKVAVVRRESARGRTIMVGDGINDAPALALATVGVAIGARGATASSEAADVVLTVDRLDRLGEARLIARRSRSIATQSVLAGMGMSLVAMVVAATGRLPVAWGAMLQEVIDVVVILWALRALGAGRGEARLDQAASTVAQHFSNEHVDLRPNIVRLRDAADLLGDAPNTDTMRVVIDAHRLLVDDIWPHEEQEDRELYPAIASLLGGTDPTATMSRAHIEIGRLIARLGLIIDSVGDGAPEPDDVRELQRLLYGLFAVLEMHMAQEDEHYLSLADA